MELIHAEHHIYRLEYHLVWCPKYRHPVFQEPFRSDMKAMIVKAASDHDMNVLEIEIPPDHVHAMVSLPPTVSISDCMRVLKSVSAREFFAKYPQVKKKFFWGGKLWSPSYYAETVGQKNEAAIRRYIQHQLQEEEKHISALRQLKLLP